MKEFVEKLIERLEEKHKCSEKDMLNSQIQYHQTVYGVQMNTYERVIEIVNQLAEEYVPETNVGKWIPCSERLPQEEESEGTLCRVVNVMLKNGIVTSGWCNRYLKKWYVLDYHSDYPVQHEYEDIIAWQPLPEPYQPEEPKQIPTDHYTERFNRVM